MPAHWVGAGALLAFAWTVAVPVTSWFARVGWTARDPVAALLAWQAIGLSGGLALLGAELSAAAPMSGSGSIGLVLFALSLAWLVGVLLGSFVRAARSRRLHRTRLELLSRRRFSRGTSFDVIDAETPLAYALPGRPAHVVVSSAATTTLTEGELQAVLSHERAHLRQRHNLVIQPFMAWERSLPFLAAPRQARRRVEQLIEMVCDDVACRSATPAELASALATLRPAGCDTAERVGRLGDRRAWGPARIALLGAALTLILAPLGIVAVVVW